MGVYTPRVALGLAIVMGLLAPVSVQAFRCEPSETVPSVPTSIGLDHSRKIASTVQTADSFSPSVKNVGTVAGPRPASANSPRIYIPARRNAEGAQRVRTAATPLSLSQLTQSLIMGNVTQPQSVKSSVVPPPDCVPMVPPEASFDNRESPGSIPPPRN